MDDQTLQRPAEADYQRAGGGVALPEDVVIVVPVRKLVLFPGVVVPVAVSREQSVAAAQEAVRSQRRLGFLLQRDASEDEPGPDGLHRVGTVAEVLRYVTAPDGTHHLICRGEQRFRALDFVPGFPFMVARSEPLRDTRDSGKSVEARAHFLRQQALEAAELIPQVPQELVRSVQGMESPSALADLIASFLDVTPAEKQSLLETVDVEQRLDKVVERVSHQLEVLKLSHEIGRQTRDSIDQRQREAMLREQLHTIRKELGDEEGVGEEVAEIAKAIEDAGMPEEAEKEARKELRRLERMPEASGEHGMVRTWLDWATALPWSKLDAESIDIARAREILDEDHHGLEKVKKRILEYFAVRKLNPEGRSPILCLVGPPGVGKTSLGRSVARTLGLEFQRLSLGGVHDEAEIRGHRRTYLGALPGNIVQSLRKAGTRNPVLMLDEMDKLGAGGFHGDPSSALLEVLDPEQNATFRDNYLGVAFDLSKVLFIGTANVLDGISGPLRDRMEVIELTGYTEEEKVEIAKRFLVRRQLAANGLSAEQASLDEAAIRRIVREYTREAGCRNLEREIGSVLRHVAVRIAEARDERFAVGADDLPAILGAPRFDNEVALRTAVPGVATGLAWTPMGGDILFVESARVPGAGKLLLTGQLGDVMKESAQAALSLARVRAADFGIAANVLDAHDVHVHVPAGAIPKDGPSAGVAMLVSLVSLLSGRRVRSDVAMTGEISLRGQVLPVGGIKEKVVAAARAGVATVILPARNRRDFDDIPESARLALEFVWVDCAQDALAAALCAEEEAATVA